MTDPKYSQGIAHIVALFVILMVLFFGLYGLVNYVLKGHPAAA